MKNYDWTQFTLKIPIKCTMKQAFDMWSTAQAIESWFLKEAKFFAEGKGRGKNQKLEAGDSYEWKWVNYDDYIGEGKVVDFKPNELVAFTFEKCEVHVSFHQKSDSTIVELQQKNIPTDDESKANLHVGCTKGWTYHLTNLKNMLEGGKDLRNWDKEISGVLNN